MGLAEYMHTNIPTEGHLVCVGLCCDVLEEFHHFGEKVVCVGVSQDLAGSGSLLERKRRWEQLMLNTNYPMKTLGMYECD